MEPFDQARSFIIEKEDEKEVQITKNLSFSSSAGSNYQAIWEKQIMLRTQRMI